MRRLLRGIGRAIRAALREWPLALALLGTASLFLVPRVASSGLFRERRDLEDRRQALREALDRLRSGEGAPLEEAARARELLSVASSPELGRELAVLLLARGYASEAAAAAREARAPEIRALALADQGRLADARDLVKEARGAEGALLRAEVEARGGKPEAALAVVVEALPAFSGPEAGRLQLERGRLLGRLDRRVEALAALDLAGEALGAPDEVALAEAELFVRAAGAEAERLAAPIAAKGGPLAPAARVLVALASRNRELLVHALARLKGPEPLDAAGLDLPWMADALRAWRETETSAAGFAGHARVLLELHRLYPGRARVAVDLGSAWRRAAELSPPAEAAARYRSAGEAFAAVPDRAATDAAAAFEAAGDLLRAAALYRGSPEPDALFRRAECLERAGVYRPGAVEAYGEVIDRVGKGDPRVPLALLARGRVFERLGDRARALGEYERVLRDDLGISPRTREWEEALLGQGRCLRDLGRLADARRALEEYLDRYGSETPPRAASVEAASLLAQAALEERDAAAALVALVQAASLPAADDRSRLLQGDAKHLLGDVLLAAGRFAEAEQAYLRAGREVWSLAGRARALARLGRRAEAREELQKARSASGGAEEWRAELDAVAREVR